MPRTRSEAGKYACQAGKQAERDVVTAMRARGFPDAKRVQATGARNGIRVEADTGDVLVDGLTIQVKRYSGTPSDAQVFDWLFETGNQQVAAGTDYGVLVVKRHGKADAGQWWAYMWAEDYVRLLGSRAEHDAGYPVRILFADLLDTLLADGYGDEEQDTAC